MAFRSARGYALCQPPIGKSLEGTVYPPEAKSLLHYINVWNGRPFRRTLAAIGHHPAAFLLVVVLFEPMTKLGAIPKVQ
jgi:hypothetical protein